MRWLAHLSLLIAPGIKSILPRYVEKLWGGIIILFLFASIMVCYIFGIRLSEKVCNLALPALSILTALVFSAIFTVPSQLEQRIKTYETVTDEATVNYLIRYRNFIRRFSRQLITICVSCLIIIMCIIPQSFTPLTISTILTGVLIPFAFELILLFFSTMINLSKLIDESISFSTELIQKKKKQMQNDRNDN